jgi:hypothetical protein
LDSRHFNRVIHKATTRFIRADARTPCVSIWAVLPWLVVVCIVGLKYIGQEFLMILPLLFVVAVGAIMYEILRFSSARERVIGARRCLGCGHPLEYEQFNPRGGGICPKCWRPFHVKEHVCPPRGWIQPDWQEVRAELIPRMPNEWTNPSRPLSSEPDMDTEAEK